MSVWTQSLFLLSEMEFQVNSHLERIAELRKELFCSRGRTVKGKGVILGIRQVSAP